MKSVLKVKLSPIQAHVLAILKGSSVPVLRSAMQKSVFGTTRNKNHDRVMQRTIQELRNFGFAIVSNSSQPGYKLANSKEEVSAYVAERLKMAKQMCATARKVERAYGLRKQMRLAGVR